MINPEEIYLRELIRIESVKFGEWIRRNYVERERYGSGWNYRGEYLDTFALYDKYFKETHPKTEQK